jgi:outer membrane receptor protein involved in Fe transport
MRMTKLAAILCLSAVAAPAAADDQAPTSSQRRAPPDDDDDSAPPPDDERAAPAADNGKTEVISVTGTTVEHELLTGRAPVSVVTRADLAVSGRATLGDVLQALPAQANGANAQVNAGGDGATRINLRGLGAARTLVLVNGRRMVNGGSGADASVDVNAIPLAMVERVEILKDGASALYGADAVGGVVNIITRPQFDGVDVSLLTSTSQHGDGTEYDASFVTGFTTKDKHTYLVVSGSYQHHEPVLAGDRAFSQFQDSYDFASRTVTRNQSLAAIGGRLDRSSIGPGGMQPPGCAAAACKPDGNGGWTSSRRATCTTRRRRATCTRRRPATACSGPPATGSATTPRWSSRCPTCAATAIASCRRWRSPRTSRSARTASTTRWAATSSTTGAG